MKLTAPSQVFFVISLVLAILAIFGRMQSVDFITPNAFWLLLVAWIVLAVACLFRRA